MSKTGLDTEPMVKFARNLDWNLLKIFLEIARRGGIGAAARSLNKQQPSVSAALQRLENHLGVALCTRTSRGIELTVHGQQVLAACEAVYGAVRDMPRAVSSARGDTTGTVTLRVISNLYLLPQLTRIFDEFHALYPRIDVRLDVAPWRAVLESLKSGEVEIAIGFSDGTDEKLIHMLLTEQIQQIYCGPKHPLFGKPPVAPALLEDDPFVVTHDEPKPYVRFRDKHNLGSHIGGFADNLQERMWLIQLGMGIGFLPKPIVDASSFAPVLWPLLAAEDTPTAPIYLMAAADPVRSAPAQLFLEVASRLLAGDTGLEP
jgi:DNA-binding transcriptional LysR family regulator